MLLRKSRKPFLLSLKYFCKPAIMITGCPIGKATEKVINAVEDNGGVVVY